MSWLKHSSMNILFPTVNKKFLQNPASGGEVWDKEIIRSLSPEGNVELIAPSRFLLKKPLLLLANLWFFFQCFKRRKMHSQIVLENIYTHPWTFLAHWTSLIFKRNPFIVIAHHLDYPLRPFGPIYFFDKFSTWLYLNTADLILVISDATFGQVKRLAKETRIHKIFFPIKFSKNFDLNAASAERRQNKALNLLFVGNCIPRKRIELLIPVMQQLGDRAHLDIIGETKLDPHYMSHLTGRVAALGLQNIVFHGRVPEDHLEKFYRRANIFVLPSLWEGLGIVLLEAMLWGLPIVTAPVGAIPELVKNDENGFLADPTRTDDFTNCLKKLIEDLDLQERMGGKGRTMALDYLKQSEACYDQLRDIVKELMTKLH